MLLRWSISTPSCPSQSSLRSDPGCFCFSALCLCYFSRQESGNPGLGSISKIKDQISKTHIKDQILRTFVPSSNLCSSYNQRNLRNQRRKIFLSVSFNLCSSVKSVANYLSLLSSSLHLRDLRVLRGEFFLFLLFLFSEICEISVKISFCISSNLCSSVKSVANYLSLLSSSLHLRDLRVLRGEFFLFLLFLFSEICEISVKISFCISSNLCSSVKSVANYLSFCFFNLYLSVAD